MPCRLLRIRARPFASGCPSDLMNGGVSIERLERALLKVARMIEFDPAVTPVFEALERDLAAARKTESGLSAAQRRARQLLYSGTKSGGLSSSA